MQDPATVRGRVLVVEDDERWQADVERLVRSAGFEPTVEARAEDGLARLQERFFEFAILDWYTAGEMSSGEFLRLARSYSPATFVIVYSAMENVDELAAEHEADDFVLKNARNMGNLRYALRRGAKRQAEKARALLLERRGGECTTPIGNSEAMQEVRRLIEEAASCDLPVMIEGETGTGKDLAARAVHTRSRRAHRRFQKQNCARLSGDLLNSDLFGHVKGAYTGAVTPRAGLFELASGGTLFLDEIGELGADAQARLLRVVEEGVVQRVGSHDDIQVDTRLIVATNRRLAQDVEAGRFRRDLFHRLDTLRIWLPPLADHMEDVEPLIEHFLRLHGGEGAVARSIAPTAKQALLEYEYPGNVRQLEHVVQRALVKARGEPITCEHLELDSGGVFSDPTARRPAITIGLAAAQAQFEATYIRRLLDQCGGNVSAAARIAGISRTHFHRKMKALGINSNRRR